MLNDFDKNDIDFINTRDLFSIDSSNNVIYYMYDYYKKWWIDKYPNNSNYKDSYFAFIALKNGNYNSSYKYKFPAAILKFLNHFNNDWLICTVPGHEKTTNESNSVSRVIDMIFSNIKPQKCYSLIQRKYEVEKKHLSNNRKFDIDAEIKSLNINPRITVKDKKIIIFDDITTTGLSLLACKKLLLSAGAKQVVVVAIGKTKEPQYGY